jgi:hypothetical protein
MLYQHNEAAWLDKSSRLAAALDVNKLVSSNTKFVLQPKSDLAFRKSVLSMFNKSSSLDAHLSLTKLVIISVTNLLRIL